MHAKAGTVRSLCNSLVVFGRSRSITHVMTAASIAAGKGGGYARYLEGKTIEPERGDYYLSRRASPRRHRAAGSRPLTRLLGSGSRARPWMVLSSSR